MTEPSNLVKIVAAFVAGVVVALGGALIFVRAGDLIHPMTVTQAAPAHVSSPARDAPAASEVQPPSVATPPKNDNEVADNPAANSQSDETESKSQEPPAAPSAPAPRKLAVKTGTLSKKHSKTSTQAVVAALKPPELPQTVPASTTPVLDSAAPDTVASEPYGSVPATETKSPAAINQPHVITLQSGTTLAIRLAEPLSTEHNYSGDSFRAVLDASVIVDGFIIAEKGSRVLGRVVESQRAGRVQGTSLLSLAVTEINTTDGQRIRVNTNSVIAKGSSTNNTDALKIASGAAIGAIIGAISGGGKGAAIGAGAGGAAGTGVILATRGRPTTLPTEAQLSFQLSEPVTIQEKLN